MKKKSIAYQFKNRGFTLIELLAVIVILAIIALIATPIILNIIEKTKKNAFQDSAYGIIESAKLYYTESLLNEENNNVEHHFSFEPGDENELSYHGEKPAGGELILSKTGEISLAIHNNKWCAIKNKEDSNVKIIKYEAGNCTLSNSPEDIVNPEITVKSDKIATITLGTNRSLLEYFNSSTNNVVCTDTSNENITITNTETLSVGTHIIKCSIVKGNETLASAEKTIEIEEEIKIEDIIDNTEVGDNGTVAADNVGNKRFTGVDPNNYVSFNNELWRIIGIFNGQMKIIRVDSIGTKAWNTTATNNWTVSSLQLELNGTYLNSIEPTSKALIDTTYSWHLGGETTAKITRAKMYESERGTVTYGNNPKTWTGAIGLMYPSDYAYATDSTNSVCDSATIFDWNDDCKQSNWLFMDSAEQWTITPDSKEEPYAYTINGTGCIRVSTDTGSVTLPHEVRPVIYLKSSVKINNADLDNAGSKTTPFTLSETK